MKRATISLTAAGVLLAGVPGGGHAAEPGRLYSVRPASRVTVRNVSTGQITCENLRGDPKTLDPQEEREYSDIANDAYSLKGCTAWIDGVQRPCTDCVQVVGRPQYTLVENLSDQTIICYSKDGAGEEVAPRGDRDQGPYFYFDPDPGSEQSFASCGLPVPKKEAEAAAPPPAAATPSAPAAEPGAEADPVDDCFITTAVCRTTLRDDRCSELTTLRWYRDNVLARSADGREDIARYYDVAPAIVASIAARPDEAQVYRDVYRRYIVPSVAAVRTGRFEVAYALYRTMTEELGARFLPTR